ncbi:MAG TPA: hypothetical protein VHD87_06670 [Acidimicrobiales bacterium]|nr:hypothetical protein [Acidimicrobiales bacterium]
MGIEAIGEGHMRHRRSFQIAVVLLAAACGFVRIGGTANAISAPKVSAVPAPLITSGVTVTGVTAAVPSVEEEASLKQVIAACVAAAIICQAVADPPGEPHIEPPVVEIVPPDPE